MTESANAMFAKPRVFKYQEHYIEDPGPDWSIDDVRRHLASTAWPKLANAKHDTIEEEDRTVIEFKPRAGTFG